MVNLKLSPVLVGIEKVFDQIRYIGLDVANSYVKISGIDFKTITYANTIKYLNQLDKKLFIKESERRPFDRLATDEIVFTYEGKDYLIGTTDKDSIQSLDKNLNRHASDEYKRNFILALARIAKSGDNFVVCTGVPSSYFNDEKIEESIQDIAGDYTVERNGVPVVFRITYIYVELEPRGTYLNTIYRLEDEKIFIKNKEISESKYVGILDIGFGTSDLAVFYRDNNKRVKLSGQPETLKTALSDAYLNLKENLSLKYPSIKNMPLIEIENELRMRGYIQPAGAPIPPEVLAKEVDVAFGTVAQNLISELKSAESTDNLNYMIFTGGGFLALKKHFKSKIEGEYRKIEIKSAQTSNSQGYLIRLYMLDKARKLNGLIKESLGNGGNN